MVDFPLSNGGLEKVSPFKPGKLETDGERRGVVSCGLRVLSFYAFTVFTSDLGFDFGVGLGSTLGFLVDFWMFLWGRKKKTGGKYGVWHPIF